MKNVECSETKLVMPIFKLMGFCGCNPLCKNKTSPFLVFTIVLINMLWIVLCVCNLKTRQHVFGIGEDIFSMFALSQVLVKTAVLYAYRKVFARIFRTLELKFWKYTNTKCYDNLSRVGKCYGVLILVTTLSIIFDPIVKGSRKHPMEFWKSDSEFFLSTPFFEIIYLLQILTIYMPIMTSISTFDVLYYFLIGFGLIQFDMTIEKLRTVRAIKDQNGTHRQIQEVINVSVEHHTVLLDYLKDVNTVFRFAILSQFIGAVFFMCFTSYLHTLERDTSSLKFPIIAVAAVFQTLFFCLSGQLITNQGETFRSAVYDLPWEEDIPEKSILTCLVVMLQVSQKELKVKAGGMIDLSLETFVSLLRAAMSYYIFLKEVMKEAL